MHTGGPLPAEYLEVILCRDVYHCTPDELQKIPMEKLLRHLLVIGIESKYQRDKQTMKKKK